MGLFKLLDEESRFPNGTDNSLVAKWQKNLGKHKDFGLVKCEENVFYIRHYAGKVRQLKHFSYFGCFFSLQTHSVRDYL